MMQAVISDEINMANFFEETVANGAMPISFKLGNK